MTAQQEISKRLQELEAMRVRRPTAFQLHSHRGGLGRVQRQEDFLFNQRILEQRNQLLSDLASLEEEEGREITMMTTPMLFIPPLPKRRLVRRIGRAQRW